MIIFAIDDEIPALSMLKEAIEESAPDAEIYAFSSVNDMLKEAETTLPDVVFTDIEMPGLTGLKLAQKIQSLKENVNIIYVTGYTEYALEALKTFASGYITKPVTKEIVKNTLEHLRFPIEQEKLVVKTFGNFSVFWGGEPVKFRMQKSMELFAYLIDRDGAPITRKEAAATLFEFGNYDRNQQKSLSRIAKWLSEDLENAGVKDVFINDNAQYYVDKTKISCDLYDYLSGKGEFLGEYMEQYYWGEDRKESLY